MSPTSTALTRHASWRSAISGFLLLSACLTAMAGLAYSREILPDQSMRGLLQADAAGPDLSTISPACLNAGLGLQSSCAPEIDSATKFFGINATVTDVAAVQNATTGINQTQIDAYTANMTAPTPTCCAAACGFNAQLCSCDPSIISLIGQFTGGDPGIYMAISNVLGTQCKFAPYLNATCPPDYKTQVVPYGPACPAA